MMELPMIGTEEKKESSKFQVTLTDKTNKNISPMEYPRINRFFDNINDRNKFVNLFESAITKSGGKLIHNKVLSHPSFESFDIFDKFGNKNYDITIYR